MSQLTLTLDDDLLQAARAYAHQQGQELEAWVAQTLASAMQSLPAKPSVEPAIEQRLALVRSLAGSLRVPADFDYKQALAEGLDEKFGL